MKTKRKKWFREKPVAPVEVITENPFDGPGEEITLHDGPADLGGVTFVTSRKKTWRFLRNTRVNLTPDGLAVSHVHQWNQLWKRQ